MGRIRHHNDDDVGFFGNPEMLAFVEDSDEQWFKMPSLRDGDVELLQRA